MQRLVALACLSLLLAAGPAAATDSASSDREDGYPSDLYPTDRCAAAKLYASASYCRAAIRAWDRGDPSVAADERLAKARARLARRWMRAEDASAEAGVSCAETTATAEEMIDLLDAGAAELAASIATSEGSPGHGNGNGHGKGWRPWGRWYDWLDWTKWRDRHHDALRGWEHDDDEDDDGKRHGGSDKSDRNEEKCEARRIQLAAQACHHLLRNNGQHLVHRSRDREREHLDSRNAKTNRHLEKQWDHGAAKVCKGGPTGEEAVEQVGAVVDAALYAGLVSPNVSQEWTMITPDEQVEYLGKTLEPICSTGTPWVFFVKRGSRQQDAHVLPGWRRVLGLPAPARCRRTRSRPVPATIRRLELGLRRPERTRTTPSRTGTSSSCPTAPGDVHWGDDGRRPHARQPLASRSTTAVT